MLISLSLIGTYLYGKASDKIESTIIDTLTGSGNKFFSPLLAELIGTEKTPSDFPKNLELVKVVRQSTLVATAFWFSAYLSEAHRDFDLSGKWEFHIEIDSLEAALTNYLKEQEINLTDGFSDQEITKDYEKIHLLLSTADTKNSSIKDFQKEMILALKENVKTDVLKGLGFKFLPKELDQKLQNGWSVEGKEIDFVDVLVLKFMDLLQRPENKIAKDAFDNKIKADIKLDTHSIQLNVKEITEKLEVIFPIFSTINKRLPKIEKYLESIAIRLADLGNKTEKLHALTKKMDHESSLRDKEVLRLIKNIRPVVSSLPIHKFLNTFPKPTGHLVERPEHIKGLRQKLKDSNQKVLLQGIAGVGKSYLSKNFIQQFQNNYKHLAFIKINSYEENGSLPVEDAVIGSFAGNAELLTSLEIYSEEYPTQEQKFYAILSAMEKLSGQNLLIIDDTDEHVHKHEPFLPIPPNWHILLISRENLLGFDTYPLKGLTPSESSDLFKKWCDCFYTEYELAELFKQIDYHPMLIALIAQNIYASGGLTTLEDFKAAIKKEGTNSQITKSQGYLHSGVITTILQIFRLSGLNDKEKSLLKQLYFLPHEFTNIQKISELLNIDPTTLRDGLIGLHSKGLIEREAFGFRMNKTIGIAVKHELEPSFRTDAREYTAVILNGNQQKAENDK